MEELEKSPLDEAKQNVETPTVSAEQAKDSSKSDSVNVSMPKVIEYGCYVLAVIFLIVAIVVYNKDLQCIDGPFGFREHRYVGGDAYNYIISASRSTAVMVKCLILTVSGFSFMIIGRLTALINKK